MSREFQTSRWSGVLGMAFLLLARVWFVVCLHFTRRVDVGFYCEGVHRFPRDAGVLPHLGLALCYAALIFAAIGVAKFTIAQAVALGRRIVV